MDVSPKEHLDGTYVEDTPKLLLDDAIPLVDEENTLQVPCGEL